MGVDDVLDLMSPGFCASRERSGSFPRKNDNSNYLPAIKAGPRTGPTLSP